MNTKTLIGTEKSTGRWYKMRRILPVLLMCLMIPVATVWSRGNQASSTSSGQSALTYWIPFGASAARLMDSYADNAMFQYKEKVTGVKVTFVSPVSGEETTAYNLLIASNDLPDMILHQYNNFGYPGGPSKAVADGVFLRLNELIEKGAPNFSKIINENPDIKRQVLTDDGLIWGMGMIEMVRQPPFEGPAIRKDWLEDLGLAMPVTIADWHNVLTQFKQKKGAASPWIMDASGKTAAFSWAYDVDTTTGWLQRDNRVVYTYTDPGYLEYLTEMNKWYKEGLIHYDFTSQDMNNWLTNGVGGAYYRGFWMFTLDENMIKEVDPRAHISPVQFPIKDLNSVTKIRNLSPNVRGNETVVTSGCKTPDLAVKWLDWNYSDEGHMWHNYGEEGVTYTMVNGKPQFTSFYTNNMDGIPLAAIQFKYGFHEGSYVRNVFKDYDLYSEEAQSTLTLWNGDLSHLLTTSLLSFTADEGNTNANIMADINIYVNEMTIRFIKGEEPLSNWGTYVQNIRNMGIDTVVRNYQAAYTRYLNRK